MKTNVVDINMLQNTNLPESCYILGFLWGDGYIYWNKNKICIEITTKDMEDIFNIFNKFGKWTTATRHRIGRQPQSIITFTSIDFCKFLQQNGYNNKNNPHNIISNIPLFNHKFFWSGLIDADGCYYHHKKRNINQFCISSSYEQDWSNFELLLNNLNIKYSIQRIVNKLNQKCSRIRITNKSNIINLGKYLYDNNIFYLKRKHEKYEQIKHT